MGGGLTIQRKRKKQLVRCVKQTKKRKETGNNNLRFAAKKK